MEEKRETHSKGSKKEKQRQREKEGGRKIEDKSCHISEIPEAQL